MTLRRLRPSEGYSFIQLLVVTTIVLILASAVQPLARVTIQREKESELRRALRDMRDAIDKFKDAADQGHDPDHRAQGGKRGLSARPGHPRRGRVGGQRRVGAQAQIPAARSARPDDRRSRMGLRAYQDKPDTTSWGGQNVFDVRSLSGGTALDGSKYKDW